MRSRAAALTSLCLVLALPGCGDGGKAAAKADEERKEVERRTQKILDMEKECRFSEALKECDETREAFKNSPDLVRPLDKVRRRLSDAEQKSAELLKAVEGLADPSRRPRAAEQLLAAGEMGLVFLRRAVVEGNETVAIEAAKVLAKKGDKPSQAAFAGRLKKGPPGPVREVLFECLTSMPGEPDKQAMPLLYALVKGDSEKNADVASFLAKTARDAGRAHPKAFNEAMQDPGAFEQFSQLRLLCVPPAKDLRLHLKFDDARGYVAANAVGAANAGDLRGAGWDTGRFGKGMNLDGAENYCVIEKPQGLDVGRDGGDFSVALWMNLKQGNTGAWRIIAHKGDNSDSERTFAMWMQPGDNRIHYRISTAASTNEGGDSKAPIELDKWTHVAYVKGGQKLSLYLNGRKDSEAPLQGKTVSNSGPIWIGKDPWHNGTKCVMDEFCIYMRALTDAEVADMAGVAPPPPPPPAPTPAPAPKKK